VRFETIMRFVPLRDRLLQILCPATGPFAR
jgi:hypothetical protein